MKTKTRKKRVLQTGNDNLNNHRSDFQTCPECGSEFDCDVWEGLATTLILTPLCYKAGYVAVMSECPKCFCDSWVHESYTTFHFNDCRPKEWKLAVEALEAQVRLSALRDWGAAICHRCKHLESGTVEFHAWRSCIIGHGPAEKQCGKFKSMMEA
jgi:hypothetical protein